SLNNQGIMRQFVTVRPQDVPHPAQTITMKKWNYFSEAAVNAAKTPLDEETDVAARRLPAVTNVVIEAHEHGDVVTSTQFFRGRALVLFEAAKARILADQSAKVIDELIQHQILSDITRTVQAGMLAAEETVVAGLQVLADNVPAVAGGSDIRVGRPHVLAGIRGEAGMGGWRVPKEYTNYGLLRRLPNALGQFGGFSFISNNRV